MQYAFTYLQQISLIKARPIYIYIYIYIYIETSKEMKLDLDLHAKHVYKLQPNFI